MPDQSRKHRWALAALSTLGALLLLTAAVIWLTGGLRSDLFGFRLRASDPLRPFGLGAGLLAVRFLFRQGLGLDAEANLVRGLFRAPMIAAVLATLITGVAFTTNYGVGSGADSYGYVSQADLWLDGNLTVDLEWLRGAPWPHAVETATPLAYRPAVSGLAAVPVYAPGLPLLLAGSKLLVGQCGFVVVIALMAGLLVGMTYGIGQRVASPQVGAAAAWIIATCPVVLFMMALPMSDVPAAALASVAIACGLRRSRSAAFLAGLSLAAVVLIRPNLAPLVAPFGVWLLVFDRQTVTWRARIARVVLFGCGVAPGAIVMAAVNTSLYGSATASGYGSLDGFFSPSYIVPNVRNYSLWLMESQTPFVAIGLLALVLPARWLAKTHRVCDASLLVLMAAGVAAVYLPYTVFDRWWYLRFFLPAWPAMAIGTAWLFTNSTGRTYGRLGVAALILVGAWGLYFGNANDAFSVGWGELRYVSAAHVVRDVTAPTSVILSMQHSGSVNYYGGRRILRYDWMEPHRLDSAIEWLKERGHDVYILLEEPEIPRFRARFAGTQFGALADETLIFRQDVATRVFLFDTRSDLGPRPSTIAEFVPSARRCCDPAIK